MEPYTVFAALAEPTRLEIMEILAEKGKMPATDIYNQFDVTPQAVSQHLRVLREASLVSVERYAQQRLYDINPEAVNSVQTWAKQMSAVWEKRLDRLENVLYTLQISKSRTIWKKTKGKA